MRTQEQLAEQFEEHRDHLRGVAYRMLGSVDEADDAVQEAWLRMARSDTSEVVNLRGWLTTVVSRISLDFLRSRRSRSEQSLDAHVPDPVVTTLASDPEATAEQADEVTLALLVVLDALNPRERMAFVLHDMFGVPFEQIGEIVDARRPPPPSSPAGPAAGSGRRQPVVADRATQRRVLDRLHDGRPAGRLRGAPDDPGPRRDAARRRRPTQARRSSCAGPPRSRRVRPRSGGPGSTRSWCW